MTKIPDEIEKAIRDCSVYCSSMCTEDIAELIKSHLGKYLRDWTPKTMTETMMIASENITQMHERIKRWDKEFELFGNVYRLVTHPTDEGIEKTHLNLAAWSIVEICMYDSVWQPWIKWVFLRMEWDRYVVTHTSDQEYTWAFERKYIRKLRIGKEVDGIEKEEPTNDDIVIIGKSQWYDVYAKRWVARKVAEAIRWPWDDKYIPAPIEEASQYAKEVFGDVIKQHSKDTIEKIDRIDWDTMPREIIKVVDTGKEFIGQINPEFETLWKYNKNRSGVVEQVEKHPEMICICYTPTADAYVWFTYDPTGTNHFNTINKNE